MPTKCSKRFARRKDNGCHAACSVRGLLLACLCALAGYVIWVYWLAPAGEESGPGDTAATRPAAAGVPGLQKLQSIVRSENNPVPPPPQGPAPALDPAVKAIVARMFEEWKRRYTSTARKQQGVGVHDMSALLVDLKNRQLYTERALRSAIERALRALAVPADQCAEVADSMLKEANRDGQKPRKGESKGAELNSSDPTSP